MIMVATNAKRAFTVITLMLSLTLLVGGMEPKGMAQTVKLTRKQLLYLISHATTKADHEKLAAYYRGKAEEAEGRVKKHQEMLRAYENNTQSRKMMKSPPHPEVYCEHLIQANSEQVKEYKELAEYHEDMAKKAEK